MWRAIRSSIKYCAPAGLLEAYRRHNGWGKKSRLPQQEFLLPVRSIADLFPGSGGLSVQTSVSHIDRLNHWLLPLKELLTIGAICQAMQPNNILEIGTYTGSTTLLMAMNTPGGCRILTIDIPPSEQKTHHHGLGTGLPEFEVGAAFAAHSAARKITQLYGDSCTFDFSLYSGSMDMVLVDADHTYQAVKKDSATAFDLLRAGGVIIWDDYAWDPQFPECEAVTRHLHEISAKKPCFHIAGTRLAIYIDNAGCTRR
jgi:predicted O-methyltransferase YrrM